MMPVTSRRLSEMTGLTPLHATTNCPDPQAAYRRLREKWGVVAPVELEPGINGWLVMGHAEIMRVVRNEQLFVKDPHFWREFAEGSVAPDSGLGSMMFPRNNAYFADGEEHRRLRAPLDEGISKIDQRRMGRAVRTICADLIDGFADRGRADLVADYAAVIPMLALADLFGLDVERGHKLHAALTAVLGSGEDALAGVQHMIQILGEVIQERAAMPADDLTTTLLGHPNLHNDEEILQAMILMISASFESTTTWIAQTLRLMLTDSRFAGSIRGGRLGVDDALDEVLWRDPPMANHPARFPIADCELGGQKINRGDALILAFAAGNADPRVHTDDPWLEIGNRAHFAWGAGPHSCPAQLPGRLIARIGVHTVLHRLPDVRLTVPADEIAVRPSPWTRCPTSLPVRFSRP